MNINEREADLLVKGLGVFYNSIHVDKHKVVNQKFTQEEYTDLQGKIIDALAEHRES